MAAVGQKTFEGCSRSVEPRAYERAGAIGDVLDWCMKIVKQLDRFMMGHGTPKGHEETEFIMSCFGARIEWLWVMARLDLRV